VLILKITSNHYIETKKYYHFTTLCFANYK